MGLNAFATRSPAQPLDMAPKVNSFVNMTAPAPAPVAPQPAPQSMNAFAAPRIQPKAPEPSMAGRAIKAFTNGFVGRDQVAKVDDRYKADAQAKAKSAMIWLQQTAAQPAEQRAAFTLQSAQDIARDTGQPYEAIVASAQDPNAFSDEQLNGAIAKFSAMAGMAPNVPEPMSAYEAAKIRLDEEEAARGPKPQIYSTSKGLVEAAPGTDPRVVFATEPDEKPPWQGAVKGPDGNWVFDPNYIKGYRQLHPQSPSGASARYENVSPEQMEALGYPKGTIGQRNTTTNQIEIKSRPSTAQTGQPTESERAGSLHSQIALNGLGNIMRMESGGYNRAGMAEQAGGLFGGENERLYDQAALEFADGYLRAMTGAAQTEGEVQRNARQFFPQFGDTAPVIKQKNAGRLNALKAMKSKAGRAWNPEWDSIIQDLEGQVGGGGIAPAIMGDRSDPAADDESFIDSLFPGDDGSPDQIPEGITPEEWNAMPPEDRALFQ